jgi:UDP-galactopyranose mutase
METVYDVIIVGAGLSGATIAEHAARDGAKVLVLEKRDHIGGNVYDYVDEESGIRVSKYGAHLWHTNDEEVMTYVSRFGKWQRWDHKVVMEVDGVHVPIPVNPTTVNALCETNLATEAEMTEWLRHNTLRLDAEPKNSEEVALSRVGATLYSRLFKPYTLKQWNKHPAELEPSVLQRIPVRTQFDDRYFSDRFQALPVHGYTSIVAEMLNHANITVRCGTDWFGFTVAGDPLLVFTGPIDAYFKYSGLPPLEYRSIHFHWFKERNSGYVQPNSVVNYADEHTPYTRCVEYKHFLHQKSDYTIYAKEIPTDEGEPYYPVPTERNRELYRLYTKMAEGLRGVHFIGRLANYKYFNMDQAVRNAMDSYRESIRPELLGRMRLTS